ncbi:hypothetical protein CYLTODRAFT_362443 [Cylindrobasidium torrendii FP15055 ss-10]|uniref:Alpha-ketoglutarate-dependent dioxygenase AlkB-like domain-containing protein n=1 Tax=Cylindrobasidium torrendii FP15055 ss-10 TaxID=1314674 RepID=A0A0D7AU64_9AGAR|nr:hypothetical protein CYLTODRAFT_362443 [Cylindrobasidium torrendii FP15055 ss-10]
MPVDASKTSKRASRVSILEHKTPSDRPPLPTHPPLWAESRQDVCETLPWFRSYQGGVYHSNRIAKGYLLSKHGSARDGWFHNGRLIISHGGGKGANLARLASGKYVSKTATDQLESDWSVRALLNTFHEQLPMVLLIDDRYPHFPYDLENSRRMDGRNGYTYVVLGFYFIKDAWVELEPSDGKDGTAVMRYKFAFQWCDGQACPWWLPKEIREEKSRKRTSTFILHNKTRRKKNPTTISQTLSKTCSECKCAAPQVYSHAWVCLNKACSMFFKVGTTTAPPLSALTYNPAFLALSKEPVVLGTDISLEPGPPVLKNDTIDLVFGTEAAFTRGWHCTKCGRMSSRSVWRCWTCASCGSEFKMEMEIQRAEDLSQRQRVKKVKPVVIMDTQNKQMETNNGLINRQTFNLPNDAGKIHRVSYLDSTKRADRIFKRYQTEAQDGSLDFKRWPLRAHRCRGQLLTNYFSQNCGEPYHYVGGTDNTVSWEKAPKAVKQAREYLTETAQIACAKGLGANLEFNEVLSAAYMEDQSMAFHSDAETGLGPVVAGLSLGSSARMTFRLRRSALKLSETSGVCKFRQRSQSSWPRVLSFAISHGDVCMMEGAGIQEAYEHTVQPQGFRIAATARCIN